MGEGSHVYGKNIHPRRDTDKGLNKQERYAVRKMEKEIRDLETEKGYIIGSDGKVLAETISGNQNSAKFDPKDLPKAKDAVMIHNHPKGGLSDSLAGRIGLPFSPDDILLAIRGNAKEVRAVTPNYVYSIRRPKGGWGENIKRPERIMEFLQDMTTYEQRWLKRQADYGRQQAYITQRDVRNGRIRSIEYLKRREKEVNDRSNVGIQYSMMKDLTKKYGFEFTRRRVK